MHKVRAPFGGGWPTPLQWASALALFVAFLPAQAAAQPAPMRPAPAPGQPYAPYPAQPMQSGGLAPPPPLQSGGLTPPPGTAPRPGTWSPQSPTAATLAEADATDSGRGLDFFYVEGELGVEYLAPEAFHGPLLLASSKKSDFGPSIGAGLGVHLLYFRVGPHVRYAAFSAFRSLTVDLDLGWRVPLGRLEPYAVLAGGYSRLASDDKPGGDFFGWNLRLGGGLDYYVSNVLSVGGSLTAEIVRLRLSGLDAVPVQDPSLLPNAYGLGIGLTLSAVVGLHF